MKYITNDWEYNLDTIIIDLNGTLTVWWELDPQVPAQLQKLYNMWYKAYLLTGNQRGNADIFEQYGLEIVKVRNSAEKEAFILSLDSSTSVAIGNARIDIWMFKHAAVSIATLQAEWIHASILSHVDIIVPSIYDALELLLDSNRFGATMKI